jgi:hypothetical protein
LPRAAGFAAVTAGGYGATATLLGQPDSSQLSLTELSEMYSRLCDATTLPLLADADTGFGNVTNVARTVRLYEKAGVAGPVHRGSGLPQALRPHGRARPWCRGPSGWRRSSRRSTHAPIRTS